MRNRTLLTGSWLSTKKIFKSQFFRSHGVRAAVFLGLLAIAVTSLMLSRYAVVTTQAQQSASSLTATTFSRAKAAARIINRKEFKQESKERNVSSAANTSQPIAQGGGGCGWTSATVYPIPIVDQAVTTVGNTLYSFTGISGGNLIANSYKFDGTTWTPIAPYPAALEAPSAVSNGTYAYIFGGGDATGTPSNTLYRYDPVANTYTPLAPAPTPTFIGGAAYLNGKIYKIGGLGAADFTNAVEAYDIASNTWTPAASYPGGPVGLLSVFTVGNYVYTAGGTGAADLAKTYRYDPATNTWDDAAIADLPATRWNAGTANYYAGAVLAGGIVDSAVSDSVIAWNASTNVWTALPNQLVPRYHSAAGVINSSFYNIGGITSNVFDGTNDNQKLSCPPLTTPVIQGSITYVSENGTPANGTPDPGETVTVSLILQDVLGVNSGNVTATLQATGGIVPVTTSQNYGVLTVGGAAVARDFTFTVPANAVCGSQITLTFVVNDGTNTTNITKTYTLGTLQQSFSENFDGVTAPALPAGWTTTAIGVGVNWVTSTTAPDTAPNSAFAPDPDNIGLSELESPAININTAAAKLKFRNKFDTDFFGGTFYDGMVLEISVNGAAYQDIIAAGGSFVSGGYTGTLSASFSNPLGGRSAWSGNSNGYIDTVINLPASANGQSIKLKWRLGSDDSVDAPGVNIDSIQVFGASQCATVTVGTVRSRIDFDGDGRTDVSVFRQGTWYVQASTSGFQSVQFGAAGDTLVPADYDADGRTDYAVWRAGTFYTVTSGTNTFAAAAWGASGDVAVAGDFVGDTKADYAVYRASNNTWYFLPGGGGAFSSISLPGTSNAYAPLALDYDGDGKADTAQVSGTGAWVIRQSSDAAILNFGFGAAGDKFVPADYDGDNRDDLAVFRSGVWYARRTATGQTLVINFGSAGDVPVPGDYDGDGVDDQAVYRSGVWYLNRSGGGFQTVSFGTASDIPVPSVLTR